MNKKTATIILNRNLPKVTDDLVTHIEKYDCNVTDIFVIEAGSDIDNLSNNMTWYINDEFTKKYGLRYPRGLNLGIKKLYEEVKKQNIKHKANSYINFIAILAALATGINLFFLGTAYLKRRVINNGWGLFLS